MSKQFKSITAEELIEALKKLPPDAQIAFASDYGDHCHTTQLHSIKGETQEEMVCETAYSDSGFAVADRDADYNADKHQTVHVIS